MGYSHYWYQQRPFNQAEWDQIVGEAKRICAKAQGALYSGLEDFASATKLEHTEMGFRVGFNEPGAWRTFPHPEIATPMQGASIKLADGMGEVGTQPKFTSEFIALNGQVPEDYETFHLDRAPESRGWAEEKREGIFSCCKTEYRPYDAVVVSILAAAVKIAPDAIRAKSDGGEEAIRYMF